MWFSSRLAVSPGSLRRLRLACSSASCIRRLTRFLPQASPSARRSCHTQVVPHAWAPIGALAQLETLSNQAGRARVVLTALAGRTAKPFVEAARGDHHHRAYGAGGPDATMPWQRSRTSLRVPGKVVERFFRMSRSIVTRCNSRRSRSTSPAASLQMGPAGPHVQDLTALLVHPTPLCSIPRSRAMWVTLAPGCLTSFTASRLNSSVKLLLVFFISLS